MSFFVIWLGFSLLILTFIAWAVVWAVRSGQFRDQDQARSLPLRSSIPAGPQPENGDRNHATT